MRKLDELREQIKQIDANIIGMLAQRQELSKQIGQLKQEEGKDIVDLSREKKLFEFYDEQSLQHHLQKPFVRRLFTIIIAYSRRVQKP